MREPRGRLKCHSLNSQSQITRGPRTSCPKASTPISARRPPPAGAGETGKYYQLMIGHVKKVLEEPKKIVPK
jgi:hypothetical protein